MRDRERSTVRRLSRGLDAYERDVGPLPSIHVGIRKAVLLEQLIESDRRSRYIRGLVAKEFTDRVSDPDSHLFNPLRAAVFQKKARNIDEACWMAFLFVLFGKHRVARWRYAADLYRGAGATDRWNWARVSQDPQAVRDWLDQYAAAVANSDEPHGFGNHRKYEALSGSSPDGTGAAIEGYVQWTGKNRAHAERIDEAVALHPGDPREAFDHLYESMHTVPRFGRLARFDYLSTLGKLDLAPIEPGHAYLRGSTGPITGARLLFETADQPLSVDELTSRTNELQTRLGVGFDVVEDALCNWQKSPDVFRPFRA